MKNKKVIKVLLVGVIVVVAGIVFSCSIKNKKTKTLSEDKDSKTLEETKNSDDKNVVKLCVHVCGQVNTPGVYYLDNGLRIYDAILAAGGFSDEADKQYLNLAQGLKDGEQIYVPSTEEVASGKVSNIIHNVGDGLVNINQAPIEELKNLPGIGDIKAEAIISYRENIGNFSTIDDIKNVAGIKDSSFEKIKDYIKV